MRKVGGLVNPSRYEAFIAADQQESEFFTDFLENAMPDKIMKFFLWLFIVISKIRNGILLSVFKMFCRHDGLLIIRGIARLVIQYTEMAGLKYIAHMGRT